MVSRDVSSSARRAPARSTQRPVGKRLGPLHEILVYRDSPPTQRDRAIASRQISRGTVRALRPIFHPGRNVGPRPVRGDRVDPARGGPARPSSGGSRDQPGLRAPGGRAAEGGGEGRRRGSGDTGRRPGSPPNMGPRATPSGAAGPDLPSVLGHARKEPGRVALRPSRARGGRPGHDVLTRPERPRKSPRVRCLSLLRGEGAAEERFGAHAGPLPRCRGAEPPGRGRENPDSRLGHRPRTGPAAVPVPGGTHLVPGFEAVGHLGVSFDVRAELPPSLLSRLPTDGPPLRS